MLVRVTRINRKTLLVEDSTHSLIKFGFTYANKSALLEDIARFKYCEHPLNFDKYMLFIESIGVNTIAFKDQLIIYL